MTLVLSLRGADRDDIVRAAQRVGWLPDRAPDSISDDGATLRWGTTHSAAHALGCTVLLAPLDPVRDPVLAWLEALPFELAVFSPIVDWGDYQAPSFGDLLPPLGWACAFRGAGHDRLVSRRWLPNGPWTLHARPGDLSIVEFHAATDDARAALEKAKPAHARMGISDEGGFLQRPFVYVAPPRGFLRDGLLEVVVHGAPPTQAQMLEACALRVETQHVEPGPVKQVAYVFMDESAARASLHELWLRGLECRAMRLGKPVRLDEDYAPV